MKTYLYENLGIYQAKTGSPREILKLAAAQELLDYSFRQNQPLYQLIEDIRIKYACRTDREVYGRWEEYKELLVHTPAKNQQRCEQ